MESKNNDGWIKIHRQILEWEWYDEPNTFRLFFHLLLKANHKPKKYRGVLVDTGQIMTGLHLLAAETKLGVQSIRTALNRLKLTNEITIKTSSQGSIIQVVKYKDYQLVTNQQQTTNKRLTNEQQTTNKRLTTNKNVKNDKNDKNEEEEIESIYNNFVEEVKNGEHATVVERWYMSLRIKKGSLTPLLKDFKTQLLTDARVHKNTLEFRKHFKNWLNVLDSNGKLNEYKKQKTV